MLEKRLAFIAVAGVVGLSAPASATTVTSSVDLAFFQGGRLSGPVEGAPIAARTLGFGPSAVQFAVGASADSANYSSFVISSVTASFSPVLDVVEARGATVLLSSPGVRGSVQTTLDGRATAGFTFAPIQNVPPFSGTLTLPPVLAVDESFQLSNDARTVATTAAFGETLRDSAGVRFSAQASPQLPVDFPFALDFGGRTGGNFDYDTTFRADGLSGFVAATHESGATVLSPFALDGGAVLTQLDLSMEGRWSLGLLDVDLLNTLTMGLTLSPFGEAFWRVGNCPGGWLRVCIAEGRETVVAPPVRLALASFDIPYPTASALLGVIDVIGRAGPPSSDDGAGTIGGLPGTGPGSDPNAGGVTPPPGMADPVTPVPIPPSLALLGSAIALLVARARRFATAKAVV
ncbi:MAG: hypothetical protein EA355_06765 [Rhodobacteraceae bacterium]|nr:MAG: hypothetical protein EA355_06765 [Paracoccaceae bacterium]